MRLDFGFGSAVQSVEVPDQNLLEVLTSNEIPGTLTNEEEVTRALRSPIGTPRLGEIVRPGEKVAIITSDVTRPVPTWRILPCVLRELFASGCRAEDITLVFALGSHRRHTEEEKRRLAGEWAYERIRCVDSDREDCVRMGVTDRGTPVEITRAVAQADRRICIGNIEYHYFAGYSGGAKAIMPGVSTRGAIQKNHSMMADARCCAGNLDTNPLRQDLEQAAQICDVDFIVNVVLDEHKEIIRAVAGDITQAHREGCKFLDRLYEKKIERRADIVVVSQGGAPKDLNLYQTQKALDNAKHAVKKGGVVILIGSCKEGLGEKVFEEWITTAPNPQSLIERIGREFRLGGHKAAAIAMVQQNADIYLVSELDTALVTRMSMTPFASAQDALDAAFRKQGENAAVLLMPYGGSTLPRAAKEA